MANRQTSVKGTYENPFDSFWMAGFECSDKLNAFGNRVDLLTTTCHLKFLHEDYAQLKEFEIRTVREGVRWSQVEKMPYQYDFSTVEHMMNVARASKIQQVWDLCHFGFPDDLTPLHPMFARRFAAFCRAFVEFFRAKNPDDTLIVTPINEVSFLSWLGGDVRGTSPYCVGQGWEVKYHLMRAYIEGTAAMREIDPSVRILTTEPLVNMVPPLNPTEQEIAEARKQHEYQFQAMDILAGRICPELGGKPEYLDIVGVNYYYNNQWVIHMREFLPWANLKPDVRWVPLRKLLGDIYYRYNRPVVIAETSHSGVHRPDWISFIAGECAAVLQQKIPLWGVCLYPAIDRPDWDHLHVWHGSGLWDVDLQNGTPYRKLHQPYANALRESQTLIDAAMEKKERLVFENNI